MSVPVSKWCSPAELAAWLGVHPKTLAKWRNPKPGQPRRGPRFVREGRTVRYAWADVYAWVNDRRKAC